MGKGNRDPSLFADVVALFGITPHEAIFVNDLLADVERARTLGVLGFVFMDEKCLLAELEGRFT